VASRSILLAAAEPFAKKEIDDRITISSTTDAGRGWLYFNLILERAGVPLTPDVEQALAELHAYHQTSNLWELVPASIVPSLVTLRRRGLRLTVVSNANGRLKVLFDRLKLSGCVDCLLDSHDEGVEKPDARYFEIALERSGARRETTIHVGDLYHVDVIGARNAGLRAVLLDEGGLYPDADCPRVGSFSEFVDLIGSGAFD
jgi:HAD superfamily hydrolase (TIGR01549 family)